MRPNIIGNKSIFWYLPLKEKTTLRTQWEVNLMSMLCTSQLCYNESVPLSLFYFVPLSNIDYQYNSVAYDAYDAYDVVNCLISR